MRMLAVDMDDTCLNSKNRISQKTLNALEKAAAAGIEIVPTTVRALSCLPHQLRDAKYIHYVISSNGAAVTDLKTNQLIYTSMIPLETTCQVLEKCRKLGIVSTIHACNELMIQGHIPTIIGRMTYGQDTARALYRKNLSAYIKDNTLDVESLQLIRFTPNSCKKAMAMLKQFPQLTVSNARKYIDVFMQNTTKGNAVAALAAHLNISKEEMACIGDNAENDSTMFSVCGLKFAVGNAEQALKDAADYVVASNDEDGVAEAIEKYLL